MSKRAAESLLTEEEMLEDHPLVVSDLGNSTMYERILDIRNVRLERIDSSGWYGRHRMEYQQNKLHKELDTLTTNDCFQHIVWDFFRQELLFVRKFKPANYFLSLPDAAIHGQEPIDTKVYPAYRGIAIELSNYKFLDKSRFWVETSHEQLRRDFGYDVPSQYMVRAQSVNESDPTTVTCKRTHYIYSEVNDSMKLGERELAQLGPPMHQVVRMNIDQAREFAESREVPGPITTLFGIRWFLHYKKVHFDGYYSFFDGLIGQEK